MWIVLNRPSSGSSQIFLHRSIPAKRIYFDVPDNDKPIVSIAKDKEAQDWHSPFFYKRDKLPLEQRYSCRTDQRLYGTGLRQHDERPFR